MHRCQIAQREIHGVQSAERLGMRKTLLSRLQAFLRATHDGQRQTEIAQPGRLLILDVEHLLASTRRLILLIDQDGLFQVGARGGVPAGEEQRAAEEKMSHDEGRLRSLRGGTRKAFLGQRLTPCEAGPRDLERAEPREHGKYLGRIAELATKLERARVGAPALYRREAAVLGV